MAEKIQPLIDVQKQIKANAQSTQVQTQQKSTVTMVDTTKAITRTMVKAVTTKERWSVRRLRGMVYLNNAFSLNMLDINKTMGLMVSRRELEDVKIILENEQWVSAIGHQQMADILTNMLAYKYQ